MIKGTVNLRRLRDAERTMVLELGPDLAPGGVAQVFRTEPNKVYRIDIMACQGTDGHRNTQAVIKVGNLKKVFDCPPGKKLKPFVFEFKAISTLSTLVLEGLGDSGFGPMIGQVDIGPGNR